MNSIDFADQPAATDVLADAARLFADAGDRSELQLEAIVYSLGAALNLLRQDQEWSELAPLQYLFAGLSRLAAGRPDPVLQPLREDKKAGKSAHLDGAMVLKQVVILLAHEVLVRGGWRKTAADCRVAELSTAVGFTSVEGKPISADMVRGWRSLVNTPEMSNVETGLRAQTSLLSDSFDPLNVVHAAEMMLNHVASNFAGIEISR